jgi:hypothetical protein
LKIYVAAVEAFPKEKKTKGKMGGKTRMKLNLAQEVVHL